jgi:hypothetical protein
MPNAQRDCNSRKTARNRRISGLSVFTPSNRPDWPSAGTMAEDALNPIEISGQTAT